MRTRLQHKIWINTLNEYNYCQWYVKLGKVVAVMHYASRAQDLWRRTHHSSTLFITTVLWHESTWNLDHDNEQILDDEQRQAMQINSFLIECSIRSRWRWSWSGGRTLNWQTSFKSSSSLSSLWSSSYSFRMMLFPPPLLLHLLQFDNQFFKLWNVYEGELKWNQKLT